MVISIPDTFTIDNSEKYIMSIRLCPDGLSFSAYNPLEAQSFLYRKVEFDRSLPYTTSLKELFFENECLVWNYKRTYVLVATSRYTMIPENIFQEKKKEDFLSFNFTACEKRILSDSVENNKTKVVYDIDEEIYEFCSRSLTNPIYIHNTTPQLVVLQKQSQSERYKHLFVVIRENMVDISCFSEGKLLFVNTFAYEQFDDLLYFILYVWRQIGLDQLHDYLSLAGEVTLCNQLIPSLQTYLQHVGRIEIPSEAYLMGGEILQAPMDLILLTVCEL
ncbi:MAG: DUF3822 family protein [Tannerellaceae bacterium]|jgi:hypothetical protein|nr:DUF3822 family protein [Tannerellaceae bacterium]